MEDRAVAEGVTPGTQAGAKGAGEGARSLVAPAGRMRAIVIDPGVDPHLRVARLGLVERWQRVFADRQIPVAVVPPTGVATALAETPAPASQTLLVWADWVIDPAAFDSFVEAISTRPEGEVCQARTDKTWFRAVARHRIG